VSLQNSVSATALLFYCQVYALTGGLPPIMPTFDIASLKKRPPVSNKKVHMLCSILCSVLKMMAISQTWNACNVAQLLLKLVWIGKQRLCLVHSFLNNASTTCACSLQARDDVAAYGVD
jgi:hypothetical protein